MADPSGLSRRGLLSWTGSAATAVIMANASAEAAASGKTFRIGVISAANQPRNGHTWFFSQYLHPTFDLDALKKHWPYAFESFRRVYRNPRCNFDVLPFPDTRITHYYEAEGTGAQPFTEVFPGVKVATKLEKMVEEVDAVWLGDASVAARIISTSWRRDSPGAFPLSVTSRLAAQSPARGRSWSSPRNIARR